MKGLDIIKDIDGPFDLVFIDADKAGETVAKGGKVTTGRLF